MISPGPVRTLAVAILLAAVVVGCGSGDSRRPSSFREERQGWIFVHIEGTPSQRGFQYGSLGRSR